MQIHIGHIIREELRRQGRTNEWLAEQIGTSPRNMWRVYSKPSIDTQLLYKISKALNANLFRYYDQTIDHVTIIDT